MKKFVVLASALSGFLALTNAAMAADLVSEPVGGFFGSIRGGYILEDPTSQWRVFGPPTFTSDYSEENIGDGVLVSGLLGYRWSDWDVAVAGQYGDFGDGDQSFSVIDDFGGNLSATHWAIDAQIGYNTAVGSSDVRFNVGVRYAVWENRMADDSDSEAGHDFEGIGPRIGFSSSTPLSGSMSLELGANAAVLFGDIDTFAIESWNCTDCTKDSTTALNLDADIGVGWNLGTTSRAVLGWQVQWWDSVNVAVTDTSGLGDHDGTSGHLLTGPYLELKF